MIEPRQLRLGPVFIEMYAGRAPESWKRFEMDVSLVVFSGWGSE